MLAHASIFKLTLNYNIAAIYRIECQIQSPLNFLFSCRRIFLQDNITSQYLHQEVIQSRSDFLGIVYTIYILTLFISMAFV